MCIIYSTLRGWYVGDVLHTVVCSTSHVTYENNTSKTNRKMDISHFFIFAVWITPYIIGKSYLANPATHTGVVTRTSVYILSILIKLHYTHPEHKCKDTACAQGESTKYEGFTLSLNKRKHLFLFWYTNITTHCIIELYLCVVQCIRCIYSVSIRYAPIRACMNYIHWRRHLSVINNHTVHGWLLEKPNLHFRNTLTIVRLFLSKLVTTYHNCKLQ